MAATVFAAESTAGSGAGFGCGCAGCFIATFAPLFRPSFRAAFSSASRCRCSARVFFRASAFSAGVRGREAAASSGGCGGFDPTSETLGSDATFSASPSAGASAVRTAPGRGTRTSTRLPSARTSNSASTDSSMTMRTVRNPACAIAARRSVPSSISSSRSSAAISASAKSTTTRGGESSFMVVNESGRSPSISTELARSSPCARMPKTRPWSSAAAPNASASAPHARVKVFRLTHLER